MHMLTNVYKHVNRIQVHRYFNASACTLLVNFYIYQNFICMGQVFTDPSILDEFQYTSFTYLNEYMLFVSKLLHAGSIRE